jgi:hypothetical protein
VGLYRHHAILVTGWFEKPLKRARRKARKLFPGMVSSIVTSQLNDFWSFFIGPNGSQEGWAESFDFDRRRDTYVAWLCRQTGRGKGHLDWVEVVYGDELGMPSAVVSDSTPPPPLEPEDDDEIPY